jgi:hypothetical protein
MWVFIRYQSNRVVCINSLVYWLNYYDLKSNVRESAPLKGVTLEKRSDANVINGKLWSKQFHILIYILNFSCFFNKRLSLFTLPSYWIPLFLVAEHWLCCFALSCVVDSKLCAQTRRFKVKMQYPLCNGFIWRLRYISDRNIESFDWRIIIYEDETGSAESFICAMLESYGGYTFWLCSLPDM